MEGASAPATRSFSSSKGCCGGAGRPGGGRGVLLQVLDSKPGPHFASIDAGLRGYKARHNLAVVYHQQGRAGDAEAQWRRVTAGAPDFLPVVGQGETALQQADWPLLEEAARRLERRPAPPRRPRRCAVARPAHPSAVRAARPPGRPPPTFRANWPPAWSSRTSCRRRPPTPTLPSGALATCWCWTRPRRGAAQPRPAAVAQARASVRRGLRGRAGPGLALRGRAAGPRTSTNTCRRFARAKECRHVTDGDVAALLRQAQSVGRCSWMSEGPRQAAS